MHMVEIEKNDSDIFLKYLDGFEEAAVWITPKVKQDCPMKEQRHQQFDINFSQNAPRVVTVPFINREIFFPEFEENLDLPANF